jgi:hypothetical protein
MSETYAKSMVIHQKVAMSRINKKVHCVIHPQLCSAQGVSLGPNNDTALAATRVGDRLFQIRSDAMCACNAPNEGAGHPRRRKNNSMWAQVKKRKKHGSMASILGWPQTRNVQERGGWFVYNGIKQSSLGGAGSDE